jgi:SAM-dependent methyltransferase
MLDVITKQEYWDWIAQGIAPPEDETRPVLSPLGRKLRRVLDACGGKSRLLSPLRDRWTWANQVPIAARLYQLKRAQDAYILSRLRGVKGKRILEVGGGLSRVLRVLAPDNECWLMDPFEGLGNGPLDTPIIPGVKIVRDTMGNRNPKIQNSSFDYVFSVSVVEHVPLEFLEAFFVDCARVLKPGGELLHAIDSCMFDAEDADHASARSYRERMERYIGFADRPDLGLRFSATPAIDTSLRFSCRYATNPDNLMHMLHRRLADDNNVLGQLVSLKAEWVKREPEDPMGKASVRSTGHPKTTACCE